MRKATRMLTTTIVASVSAAQEPFTVVVIPDTQNYVDVNRPASNLEFFLDQTAWIVDHVQRGNERNIALVSHVGDIVQRGNRDAEWAKADQAMSALDGVVPWSVLPGNHDWNVTNDKTSGIVPYIETFGPERFERERWFGGHSANRLNTFQEIEVNGFAFVHLAIEWNPPSIDSGPRDALGWAQAVLDARPTTPVILSTHEYVDNSPAGRDPIGDRMWEEFIRRNNQIFLVLNGHFCSPSLGEESGTYHQTSTNDAGRPVHEVLQDFQCQPCGGNGWLRLIEIDPVGGDLYFQTYSPSLDAFRTSPPAGPFAGAFTLSVDLATRFACSPEDLSGDATLDAADTVLYLDLTETDRRTADLNGDRDVDIFDLLLFQRAVDAGCSPN